MAKRKAKRKTEVTYDVEFRYGGEWLAWSSGHKTLREAKREASSMCACGTRIVRVEAQRTVVAEVKP